MNEFSILAAVAAAAIFYQKPSGQILFSEAGDCWTCF